MFITAVIILTIVCIGSTFSAFKKGNDIKDETVNDSYSLYQIYSIFCVKAMLMIQAIWNIEYLAMMGYYQFKVGDDKEFGDKLVAT